MMTDNIKVIKADGQEVEGLKASVQSKGIYLMQSDVLIEPNDLIQRIMSNGGTETFKVIDPGFHEGVHSIPAHYQMKVQKLGIPEAEKAIQSITYNISGPNARVNNHSTDNSTNIVNVNQDVADHLVLLREEIEKLVNASEERKDALEVVDAIQGQFESGSPSKAVIKSLVSALPHAGSIASIGSFLLSAIGG
ncbi:hypothetical protein HTZ97_08110 [Desulfuromonas acetoxidans]|nr:hypothetical protein [Desulfuromonas acetoxidans]NVD24130.1 hypothetical protein [Desulfuromonas acetoxidans]NVE16426.1 hypothetical protein [Desulfuromonas acetoxidans]